ncbi:MAG: hypothetical protein Q9165_007468 [Trypethelium subeluteriae]
MFAANRSGRASETRSTQHSHRNVRYTDGLRATGSSCDFLPVFDSNDIARFQNHRMASTITQSSTGYETFETPPTPQSTNGRMESPRLKGSHHSNSDGQASVESPPRKKVLARPQASTADSLATSETLSSKSPGITPTASGLTDPSMDRHDARGQTAPSSASNEPRWPSPAQHPNTEVDLVAWRLSRLLEGVELPEASSASLLESIGSQFPAEQDLKDNELQCLSKCVNGAALSAED